MSAPSDSWCPQPYLGYKSMTLSFVHKPEGWILSPTQLVHLSTAQQFKDGKDSKDRMTEKTTSRRKNTQIALFWSVLGPSFRVLGESRDRKCKPSIPHWHFSELAGMHVCMLGVWAAELWLGVILDITRRCVYSSPDLTIADHQKSGLFCPVN